MREGRTYPPSQPNPPHPIPSHPIPSSHLIRESAKKSLALKWRHFFWRKSNIDYGGCMDYGILWGYSNQKLESLLVQECQPAIKSVRQMFLAGNHDRTMRNPNDVKGAVSFNECLPAICGVCVSPWLMVSPKPTSFPMVFPKIAGELTTCQPEISGRSMVWIFSPGRKNSHISGGCGDSKPAPVDH